MGSWSSLNPHNVWSSTWSDTFAQPHNSRWPGINGANLHAKTMNGGILDSSEEWQAIRLGTLSYGCRVVSLILKESDLIVLFFSYWLIRHRPDTACSVSYPFIYNWRCTVSKGSRLVPLCFSCIFTTAIEVWANGYWLVIMMWHLSIVGELSLVPAHLSHL